MSYHETNALEWAIKHKACNRDSNDAVPWLRKHPDWTLADAWEHCHHADWMLWALEKAGLCQDTKALHEFACRVSERALEKTGNPDPRSLAAIKTKRAWLRGEATDEELTAARKAAKAAWAEAEAAVWAVWPASDERAVAWTAAWTAARTAWTVAEAAALTAARGAVRVGVVEVTVRVAVQKAHANILRELLNNPFREDLRGPWVTPED
jgi:hypothetical protein